MNKLKDKSLNRKWLPHQQRIDLIRKAHKRHLVRRNREWPRKRPVNPKPKNPLSSQLENNDSNVNKLLALISENKPGNLELIKEFLSRILNKVLKGLGITSKEQEAVDSAQKFIRDLLQKS